MAAAAAAADSSVAAVVEAVGGAEKLKVIIEPRLLLTKVRLRARRASGEAVDSRHASCAACLRRLWEIAFELRAEIVGDRV